MSRPGDGGADPEGLRRHAVLLRTDHRAARHGAGRGLAFDAVGEKLRSHGLATDHVTVFLRTSEHDDGLQRSASKTVDLPEATADTMVLVKAACWGARLIWRTGFRYSKARLVTVDLVAPGSSQRALFGGYDRERWDALMGALDRVNARWGRGTLRPATASFKRSRAVWDTSFEIWSPLYTTRLDGRHGSQPPVRK